MLCVPLSFNRLAAFISPACSINVRPSPQIVLPYGCLTRGCRIHYFHHMNTNAGVIQPNIRPKWHRWYSCCIPIIHVRRFDYLELHSPHIHADFFIFYFVYNLRFTSSITLHSKSLLLDGFYLFSLFLSTRAKRSAFCRRDGI